MKDNREFYLVNFKGRQFEGYRKEGILVCRETNPVIGYPRKNGKIREIDFSDCKILESYIGARSYWKDVHTSTPNITIKNIREFNNCGDFIAEVNGEEYFVKWKIKDGVYEYISKLPNNLINEIRKQFEI